MLIAIIFSFFAGALSVLAPCILPLLPLVLSGTGISLKDKIRPYLIVASLALSVFLATLLLKSTTAILIVSPQALGLFSGVVIVVLGLLMLFPESWSKITHLVGLEAKSQQALGVAGRQKGKYLSAVLTGFALGPVFASCSPVYLWIVSTVLRESLLIGVVYLISYILGLSTILLLISKLGQRITSKLSFLAKPDGVFVKAMALIFIVMGFAFILGWDRQIQAFFTEYKLNGVSSIESYLSNQLK